MNVSDADPVVGLFYFFVKEVDGHRRGQEGEAFYVGCRTEDDFGLWVQDERSWRGNGGNYVCCLWGLS